MREALIALLALCAVAHAVRAEDKGQFYLAVGRFSPTANPQFADQKGHFGLVVGGGGRFSPRVSWDIDFLFADQGLDTPSGFGRPGFLVSQSERSSIETLGLGGIVKATLPIGIFEPFAGGGVGFYRSTLTIPRAALLFINQDIKRHDQDFGWQLVVGAHLRLGQRWALGFEWRKLDLKAQFGSEVPGEVKVGGNFGLLHSRWSF